MERSMKLFAQISKIDEARREVWGVATSELVDKDGEIFDYRSSKPFFKSWSDEISKATDGKSLGNVREMHEPSAVGKLVEIGFDDELKEIRVAAKIIDDEAWRKCAQGVYTGFSIGGAYVNAWKDGEFTRYTARPVEISVVDNPCNPGAHFTAVKADGSWEVRKFIPEAALPGPARQRGPEPGASTKGKEQEMEKIGARHSAETQAHHEAINKSMTKIAQACGEAQDHVNALLGKDDANSAARPSFTKRETADNAPQASAAPGDGLSTKDQSPTMADGASALAKVAAVEKGIEELRSQMHSNLQEIGEALTNLTEIVSKLSGGDQAAKAARTAVPVFTVKKEDDAKPAGQGEDGKSVHELLKQALQKPQRASYYLR